MPTTFIVSHTHWDREWYHAAGRFRQRLVALVDELLDDPPRNGASFLLDGQAVLVEDYLAVRPERSAELAAALGRGALEAGPWFVLGDELIPGAEAMVRNLLAGRRVLRSLRAQAPPVLYCPDSFGHPVALPALAAGFEFDVVIAWRGFGSRRWPASNACWWRAPSGERALLYHLPRSGYEFGADLPPDPGAALLRWSALRSELAPRERLNVSLLLNGADHHARQRDLPAAVAALARAATPHEVRHAGLAEFAAAVLADARHADLPEVEGELRDSYGYTWTLQGTLASRAHQKRNGARAERLLVRDVEPWAALAARRTGRSRRALVAAAWRELLLCQPHDTRCGCSIDTVARAFDTRLESVAAQGEGLRGDALDELAGHDPEAARRARDSWRPHLIVRNPAPRPRGGVAIVSVSRFLDDVRVGPGSGAIDAGTEPRRLGPVRLDGVDAVQLLAREVVHERLESPRAYPDDDLVERAQVAIWTEPIPGYGLRAFPIGAGSRRRVELLNPVRGGAGRLGNGLVEVAVDTAGAVTIVDAATGRAWRAALALEDQDDGGDLYTPSLRGAVRDAGFVGARVIHPGPLVGAIETRWRVDVRRGDSVKVTIRLSLHADSPLVRVVVAGENGAPDHRLRLRVRTDVDAPVVRADAAFGPVVRRQLAISADEAATEVALPTAPLHRYVSLTNDRHGATIYSDGLAEYEATDDGAVAITLVRAVGELSRNDLAERPGHAGWPAATPDAQCLGAFDAEFALHLHASWSDEAALLVERTADDVLAPVTGETIRSMIAVAPEMPGLALDGEGLTFSSAKQSEDGDWLVLRCVNVLDRSVSGRWTLAGGMREARVSRLDETPGAELPVTDDGVKIEVGPRGISTILVR